MASSYDAARYRYTPGSAPTPTSGLRTASQAVVNSARSAGGAIAAPARGLRDAVSSTGGTKLGGAVAAGVQGLREARDLRDTLSSPQATDEDKATQTAEAAARTAGAGAGAMLGTTAGATVGRAFGGVGSLVGGIAGGYLGGKYGAEGADWLIRKGREAFGTDVRSPAERLGLGQGGGGSAPAQPAAAPTAQAPTPPAASPAQPTPAPTEALPDGWQSRAVDMGLGSKDSVQRITTPDGRTLYTNQASGNVDFMTGKGGGVSTVGTEGLRAKAAELAAQGQQGLNAPAAGFNTTGTVTARNQDDYDKSRAQYLAEQAMSRYGPRGAAIANTVLDNYQQGLRTREGTRVAEMRERGDMERARIGDETQRYGIDTGAQVSLRGQDMADRRAAVTAQRQGTMDAARLQLDAARLGLDRDKMTAEDADRDRKARGEAQTKLAEWVRSITPAGADNKPDTAREADVLQAANDLAAYQRQALAAMANDPNATPEQRKAAAARVQALQRDGAAALDEVGRQQLMQLIKLRDQARASKTPALVPWGTSAGRDASITDFLPAERKPGTLGFGSDITTRGGWDVPGRELENVDLDILGLRTK